VAFKLTQIIMLAGNATTPLAGASVPCKRVIIQPHPDNSGDVYVGDDQTDIVNKWGIQLAAPVTDTPLDKLVLEGEGGNVIDLATLYAGGTEDDLLNILYEEY
jgi:hypothetical protein